MDLFHLEISLRPDCLRPPGRFEPDEGRHDRTKDVVVRPPLNYVDSHDSSCFFLRVLPLLLLPSCWSLSCSCFCFFLFLLLLLLLLLFIVIIILCLSFMSDSSIAIHNLMCYVC